MSRLSQDVLRDKWRQDQMQKQKYMCAAMDSTWRQKQIFRSTAQSTFSELVLGLNECSSVDDDFKMDFHISGFGLSEGSPAQVGQLSRSSAQNCSCGSACAVDSAPNNDSCCHRIGVSQSQPLTLLLACSDLEDSPRRAGLGLSRCQCCWGPGLPVVHAAALGPTWPRGARRPRQAAGRLPARGGSRPGGHWATPTEALAADGRPRRSALGAVVVTWLD